MWDCKVSFPIWSSQAALGAYKWMSCRLYQEEKDTSKLFLCSSHGQNKPQRLRGDLQQLRNVLIWPGSKEMQPIWTSSAACPAICSITDLLRPTLISAKHSPLAVRYATPTMSMQILQYKQLPTLSTVAMETVQDNVWGPQGYSNSTMSTGNRNIFFTLSEPCHQNLNHWWSLWHQQNRSGAG